MTAGQRRYKRYRVENMNIRAKTLFAVETELVNVSMGGACLKARQSFKDTDKQLLKLSSGGTPLIVLCSVVWEAVMGDGEQSLEKRAPIFKAGVSFGNMPSDKLVKLKDFIRQSGSPCEQKVSDAYKPSLLRFQIHANEKAFMYYANDLPVKKIGLGGMLVELRGNVQPESVFLMELSVPNEPPPMRCRGRIASRIPVADGREGHIDVGIEFLDMTLADRYRLSKFLLFSKIPFEK